MVVHGARRKPRALLEGLPQGTIDQIGPLFGSYREVRSDEPVDETEFDVLVTTGAHRRSGLHVLVLEGSAAGFVHLDEEVRASTWGGGVVAPRQDVDVHRIDDVLSEQLAIPEEVRGATRDLVERSLVPAVAAMQPGSRPRWLVLNATREDAVRGLALAGITPLLTGPDPRQVMAFHARRAGQGASVGGVVVALPVMPTDLEAWVRWFLDLARAADPGAFPAALAWQDDPAWMPPSLRAAGERRAELVEERRAALEEYERKQAVLDDVIAAAREEAASGIWQLVTEQGPRLAEAVQDALARLGFTVTDSDVGRPENEPKMEDLRAADLSAGDWIALVEVKGVARGASPRGASQLLGQPVRAFREEVGRYPDAAWYVVNHNVAMPPDERPVALERDSIIELLEDNDGAFIDTRDLLRALLDVEAGTVAPDAVRADLRAARGRWTWPPRDDGGPNGA